MPILKAKMMMIIIAFMSVFTACSGLHVNLELASSKDYNYTKCIKGLLKEDKFLLIGNITGFEINLINKSQVLMESKNKNNETEKSTLRSLDIKECNNTKDKTFTCKISIDNKEVITKYTESAKNKFNDVSLFLRVYYNGSSYDSSTIELPRIYDPKEIRVLLNEQELSKNATAIFVKNSSLHFRCQDAPEPCEVSIYEGASLMGSNLTSLIFKNVDIKKNVYTFEYKVCNSEHVNKYAPCLIEEFQSSTADNSIHNLKESGKRGINYEDAFIATLCVLIVAIFVLIVCIFLVCKIPRYRTAFHDFVYNCFHCRRQMYNVNDSVNPAVSGLGSSFKEQDNLAPSPNPLQGDRELQRTRNEPKTIELIEGQPSAHTT